MAHIIQFENVGLRYGTGAETLSDITFSLAKGVFYFLTGPSGAGKILRRQRLAGCGGQLRHGGISLKDGG
jgi:ABC-type ATPase involved in cell division